MRRNYFRRMEVDRNKPIPHSPIRDACDLMQLRSIDQSLTSEEEAELLEATQYSPLQYDLQTGRSQ